MAEAASGRELTAAAIDADFARLAAWAKSNAPGRDLYLAEFGVGHGREPGSSRRYIAAVSGAAVRHGIGWAIYDYESGRAIRDARGRPTAAYDGLGIAPAPATPISR